MAPKHVTMKRCEDEWGDDDWGWRNSARKPRLRKWPLANIKVGHQPHKSLMTAQRILANGLARAADPPGVARWCPNKASSVQPNRDSRHRTKAHVHTERVRGPLVMLCIPILYSKNRVTRCVQRAHLLCNIPQRTTRRIVRPHSIKLRSGTTWLRLLLYFCRSRDRRAIHLHQQGPRTRSHRQSSAPRHAGHQPHRHASTASTLGKKSSEHLQHARQFLLL